jgi:hypothetical protein
MKSPIFYLVSLLLIISISSCVTRTVVMKQPNPVVTVRPVAPSPQHIWVGGNYVRRGGRNVWVEGYWAKPRYQKKWVDGHWKSHRRGYVWVSGHWR